MIDKEIADLMTKLDSLDDNARMRLLSSVDSQRSELLGVLLRHLGTSQSKNVQAAAIYLIGRHHLVDGVPELIKWIDFAPGGPRIPEPEPLWEKYPAMEALINIGRPSVAPAIELLATDSNDLRRSLAVKVLRYVETPDVAKFILQKSQDSAADEGRKSMLVDALSRLDKLIAETQ
jgi:HEAT repeat protein